MVAREVYRYKDTRGDRIIFKFDPTLISDPSNEALEVFHMWSHETKAMYQWSSMLLDPVATAERWMVDKKPMVGLLLWQGLLSGRPVMVRFVGYEKNKKGFVVERPGKIFS